MCIRDRAKEVHVRPACPPIMFGCKYLNFSRSSSELDLVTRRVIQKLEGDNVSDETVSYTHLIGCDRDETKEIGVTRFFININTIMLNISSHFI